MELNRPVSFEMFPQRNGYQRILRDVLSAMPKAEVPKLQQSWLFSGFVTEFFGSLMDPEDFVQGH